MSRIRGSIDVNEVKMAVPDVLNKLLQTFNYEVESKELKFYINQQ